MVSTESIDFFPVKISHLVTPAPNPDFQRGSLPQCLHSGVSVPVEIRVLKLEIVEEMDLCDDGAQFHPCETGYC